MRINVRQCYFLLLFVVFQLEAFPIEAAKYFDTASGAALGEAARTNSVQKIRALIESGVDVNIRGRSNLTALYLAIANSNVDAFDCLLDMGANPNIQFSETGSSVVSVAAANPNSFFLAAALKHGGDPNQRNLFTGLPPIWRSVEQLLADNVKLLIAAGADVNVTNDHGLTLMMLASEANRYDIDIILLDAKADPHMKNKWGKDIVSYMRRIGIDPHSQNFLQKEEFARRLSALGVDASVKIAP